MKNFFLILSIIFIGLSACNQDDSQELIPDTIKATKNKAGFDNIMQSRGTNTGSDAFEILEATIDNDVLTVTVQYSGGCVTHDFEAVWSGEFYPTFAPPTLAPVIITHNANDDPCEALPTQTLKIDVKKLFGADYSVDKFVPIVLNGSSNQNVVAELAGNCDFTGTVTLNDNSGVHINLDNGRRFAVYNLDDLDFQFRHMQRVSVSHIYIDTTPFGALATVHCIEEIGQGGNIQGVVKDYTGLDGCGFVIELEDGSLLEPADVMVPDFEFKDDQKVWLSYVPLDNQVSVCMVGTSVRITGIEERE